MACFFSVHIIKKKNLIAVFGGMTALLGMFLPYVEGISFFRSLSGPEHEFFAECLTLMIAFSAILYALGLKWLPQGISIAVLVFCLIFPGYACWTYGSSMVLPQLRVGAWVLLAGVAVFPFFRMSSRRQKTPNI